MNYVNCADGMSEKSEYSEQRRRILKTMAAAGGGAFLAGCSNGNSGGNSNGNGNGNGNGDMEDGSGAEAMSLETAAPSYVWPQEDSVGLTLENEYSINLNQNAVAPGPEEVLQIFLTGDGQQFDALNDSNSMEDILGREDQLHSIDESRIENWEHVHEELKEGGAQADKLRHDGELLSSPATTNADGIAVNTDVVGDANSWGVLFDEQFSGQTAVIDDWANTLCWTALYLRENDMLDIDNPSNMTKEEVGGVIDFLVENKNNGQFLTIWQAYGNLVELLATEELVATYAFLTAFQEASDQGAPLEYPTLREGHYEWNDNWHMTNGCVDRGREEAWYQLANYALSPKYGADMVQTRSAHTGLDFDIVKDYVRDHEDQYDIETVMERFEATEERFNANGDTFAWNNMDPDAREAYTDGWEQFLNA